MLYQLIIWYLLLSPLCQRFWMPGERMRTDKILSSFKEESILSVLILSPEILDARRENENRQNTLLFERSQVADSPSDNAIVFGD